MRVIAGKHKGRIFKAPSGNRTHPMSERARGALFNMLGPIEGLSVLDAYAGSGALGFEAVSRGAASVYAVDMDKKAYKTITENIEDLGLKQSVRATRANVVTWAKNVDYTFDLIFADPPYQDLNPLHLRALASMLAPGGLMVISHPKDYRTEELDGLRLVTQRSYARATISILKAS